MDDKLKGLSLEDLLKKDKRLVTSDMELLEVTKVPSNILVLDELLLGGWPEGKMAELFGPAGGGKSSIALSTAVAAQEYGRVAWFDLEDAFNPALAESLGLDLESIIFVNSESAEDVFDAMETLVMAGGVSMIVVDSVAGLTPAAEIAGDYGDSHMGLVARIMSQGLRKLSQAMKASDSKTTILWINQIRDTMSGFGSGKTTTGGKALPFWCSTRVDVVRIEQIKDGPVTVGQKVRVTIVKSRYTKPFQKAEFDIVYDRGINNSLSLVEMLIESGLIKKAGSWLTDLETGETLAQGKGNFALMLDEDSELMNYWSSRVTRSTD